MFTGPCSVPSGPVTSVSHLVVPKTARRGAASLMACDDGDAEQKRFIHPFLSQLAVIWI